MPLQVVILAGGLATRLRPITETIPKALVPVNGEPFLAHQLRLLKSHGIEEVLLCLGYRGEMVREYVGNGESFGLRVEYAFDGPKLLGTAGAIRQALPALANKFFVLYGDSYLPCDYQAAARFFEASGKLGLMTVFHNQSLWDTSNVEFAEGRIRIYDKVRRNPSMTYIDYGLGAFHRSVFAVLAPSEPHDLAAVYQQLLAQGQLAGLEMPERFYEIGSPSGLAELSEHLRKSYRVP